tara:strand:+ start:293 stop:724 length:432 start_codon:yes stop_codon:yes gene_type:complete
LRNRKNFGKFTTIGKGYALLIALNNLKGGTKMAHNNNFNSHFEGNCKLGLNTKDEVILVADDEGKYSNNDPQGALEAMKALALKLSEERGKTIRVKSWTPQDQMHLKDLVPEILCKWSNKPYMALRSTTSTSTSSRRKVEVFD